MLQYVLRLAVLDLPEQGIIIFIGNIYAKPCFCGKAEDAREGIVEVLLDISFDGQLIQRSEVAEIATWEVHAGQVVVIGFYVAQEIHLLKGSAQGTGIGTQFPV